MDSDREAALRVRETFNYAEHMKQVQAHETQDAKLADAGSVMVDAEQAQKLFESEPHA